MDGTVAQKTVVFFCTECLPQHHPKNTKLQKTALYFNMPASAAVLQSYTHETTDVLNVFNSVCFNSPVIVETNICGVAGLTYSVKTTGVIMLFYTNTIK